MQKHDSHYQRPDGIEPIEVIEDLIMRQWQKNCVPPQAMYSIGNALKYLLRAGLKEGQPYHKDLDKAMNYIHRAKSGKWVNDG